MLVVKDLVFQDTMNISNYNEDYINGISAYVYLLFS